MSQNSLRRGNELNPVIPGFILVIPGFILVIPGFILVIPGFILVIPGFILVIPGFILVIPAKAGIHSDSPPEPYCPVPPGLVTPEKAEIHRWRWIPAFAGMTTSEHRNKLLEFCDTHALRGNAYLP
ncbi:hypothetical protein [Endozoicomonas sp. 8E]|uniref:hypothetical protein n=1 Tax=Endozoicomonas sp. 8E TaxID=3035692 RepID=UPI0029391EF3|nr:hypothetical protein [Endozoicomonas sp. 8E]WOG27445.1 hypothetical protein P6910_23310 [Endozoicomonas sp. 8E]